MRPYATLAIAGLITLCGQTAFADKLNVVTSIRPIESLVQSVGKDLINVTTLVPANGSPHNYALKPSDAKSLQNADVIFWIDEHFESFLEKAIETLPQHAAAIALAEQDGINVLNSRDVDFGANEQDHHDEEHEAGHNHDEDHEHEHEELHDHEEAHDSHEGHNHGAHDLHIWLDPENAKTMSIIIAQTLAELDPANADAYNKNANDLITNLDTLILTTSAKLDGVKEQRFVTFHDAYQYYEKRFGLNNAGVVTISPEIKPGAKRLQELKHTLQENQISCVFSEPQFDAKLVDLAIQGTNVRAAELDPLGANLNSGTTLYFDLIEQLTNNMVSCLSQAQ